MVFHQLAKYLQYLGSAHIISLGILLIHSFRHVFRCSGCVQSPRQQPAFSLQRYCNIHRCPREPPASRFKIEDSGERQLYDSTLIRSIFSGWVLTRIDLQTSSKKRRSEVGGLSSTRKSFRVVRACARCVCLVSSGQKSMGGGFPFSLFA